MLSRKLRPQSSQLLIGHSEDEDDTTPVPLATAEPISSTVSDRTVELG
jgi:hypothetical protein